VVSTVIRGLDGAKQDDGSSKRAEEGEGSNRTNYPKGTEERDQHDQEVDHVVGDEVSLVRREI